MSSKPPDTAREGAEYAADRPLEKPEQDLLGYSPFARTLATGIAKMHALDGMVVAINGEWGLGKSTVINFVEHELNKSHPDEFLVFRFNPWWFSGRDDLASTFLWQLHGRLTDWDILDKDSREAFKNFATIASAAGGAVPIWWIKMGAKGLGKLVSQPEADVPALKAKVSKALREQGKRILIVIDDIDRLTGEELTQLFGAVKALADFPNVIYLLAFDKDKVAQVLTEQLGSPGLDYLEKIVQVAFDVPLPERAELHEMFTRLLHEIVGEVDDDLLDQSDWQQTLMEGISPLLRTPRNVINLTNGLRVSYPALKGNVNVVDLVGLETVRLFSRPVYDRIRNDPEMFGIVTGTAVLFAGWNQQQMQDFHKDWIGKLPDQQRKAVPQLVGRLFPEARKTMPTPMAGGHGPSDHQKARRICVPELFHSYFRLALGEQIAPRAEVHSLIAQAKNPAALGQSLLELRSERIPSGRTRASVMLEELGSQADRFAPEDVGPVIKMLLDIGDEFGLNTDRDGFAGVENGTRLVWLIGALLERLPVDQRADVLKEGIKNARSISLPVLVVRRLERQAGVEDSVRNLRPDQAREGDSLLGVADLAELERIAAGKIAERAHAGELWDTERFIWLLAEWGRWADEADVEAWVRQMDTDDEFFGRFLSSCQSKLDRGKNGQFRLNPRSLADHAGPGGLDELTENVKRLAETADDGPASAACAQYLYEADLIAQGRDPDWEA